MVFWYPRNGREVTVGRLQNGLQVPDDRFLAPMRPSAARAALRGTSPLPHLFRASHSCEVTSVRLVCSIRYRRGRNCSSFIFSHTPRLQPTWHRNNWPETNVGAGLSREAPRGRRSIARALHLYSHALEILNPHPNQTTAPTPPGPPWPSASPWPGHHAPAPGPPAPLRHAG